MQCKEIPDLPILRFLDTTSGWCNWFDAKYEKSVRRAMPPGVPGKLVLAKMRVLVRNGLVSGCPCGCRGDFEITPKGVEQMSALMVLDAWA